MSVKMYASALGELALILLAALADIDLQIRIITGIVGIVLAVLTSIKFVHDIRQKRLDVKIKRLELERKDEELRRYMEEKYK